MTAGEAIQIVDVVNEVGVVAVLVLLCLWLGYMFMRERKNVEMLHDRIAETGKEVTAAITSVDTTVKNFDETLKTLKPFLRRDD